MADKHMDHIPADVVPISSPEILASMPPSIMYMGEIPASGPARDGFTPTFISDNVQAILGYEPAEILDDPHWWREHLHPDDRAHVLSCLQTLFARERLSREYRFRHREGHYLWVQDEAALVRDGEGRAQRLVGTWRNVTLRKRAAEELNGFQIRYQNIFENMIDVYYKTDMDGRLQVVSPSCLAQTGYAPAEVIGRKVTEFYEDPSQRQGLVDTLHEQGLVNDFELKLMHKDGSLRYASATSHIVYDQHHRPVGVEGILRNVTERHQTEEQLSMLLQENRRLMLQLMQIQEEERQVLARELHDELGQSLTGIDARAEYIRKQAGDPDILSSAHEITRDTKALFRLSHTILKRLRPAALDTLGLAAALEELVNDWCRQTGTACTLNIDEDIDHLGGSYNIAIYRLVQEALTNAYRHGKATRVDVAIQNLPETASRPHSLQIEIEDNGKGIRVENVATGMGVIGMRERVHALGGTFLIADLPFDGVRIDATIPLEQAGTQS